MKACIDCGGPAKAHPNAKRCDACAEIRNRLPASTLTTEQKLWLREHAGTMTRKQCAAELGVSIPNVQRAARDMGMSLAVARYPRCVIDAVVAHYEEHGAPATRDAFPHVSLRSIIERVPHAPRQQRWTDDQLILAARMVGFIDYETQAVIMNRPRANGPSIRSLWVKRFGILNMGRIHGMSRHEAKLFLLDGFPTLEAPFMERKYAHGKLRPGNRHVVLWAEMRPWLRPDVPEFFPSIVDTMTQFQQWIYGSSDVRGVILGMMDAAGVVLD